MDLEAAAIKKRGSSSFFFIIINLRMVVFSFGLILGLLVNPLLQIFPLVNIKDSDIRRRATVRDICKDVGGVFLIPWISLQVLFRLLLQQILKLVHMLRIVFAGN